MLDEIQAWLAGTGPPPAVLQGRRLPAGTPDWLQPQTLPPVHLGTQAVSWRQAFALLWSGDPRVMPLLTGAEALCIEVVRRWLVSRQPAETLLHIALLALSPAARMACLLEAVRDSQGLSDVQGAARLLSLVDALEIPDLWGTAAFLSLWPRRPHFAHCLQRALAARDPAGDWRALLLERLTEDLPQSYSLSGATVRAVPGSLDWLRGALLEEAMCAEARWEPMAWQERIAPWVTERDLLVAVEKDGRRGVLHPAQVSEPLPLREAEAFAQCSRPVVRISPDTPESTLVRRYRGRERVPTQRVWTQLLRRGWRRGQIMDYPRVFEVCRSLYAWDLCVFIRLSPGMSPHSPGRSEEDGLGEQQIFGVGFQVGAQSRPPWGGSWRQRLGNELEEPPEEPHWQRRVPLGEVSPIALSEVLWRVEALLAPEP